MSAKNILICRKCSTVLLFMLLLQATLMAPAWSQGNQTQWQPITQWLQTNLQDLGGRAMLVVHNKNGNTLYSHSENNLSSRQKMVGKFIAKRQGIDADDAVGDLNENSRLRIASCSKWLSAALVMTYVDDGKISLDDTIGKWLPVMTANRKGHIKLWQCLSHLTGIKQIGVFATATGSDADNSEEQKGDGAKAGGRFAQMRQKNGSEKGAVNKWATMDIALDSIAAQPMEGEPGKTFHYGNAGLQIAAAIIEKVSGKGFEEAFLQKIAKPCGMTNTDFGHVAVPLAAGGAFSTPNDYIHFLDMILNNGKYKGKQVISPKSIAAMQVNRAAGATIKYSPAEAGDWGYGFGEWVMQGATETKSDGVTSPGLFGSFPWVDNANGYCGFLFTFNVKSKGRNEKYKGLKKLVDEATTHN